MDDNRECEFIHLGRNIAEYLEGRYGKPMELGAQSCEMLAREIHTVFRLQRAEVWEDDENGAVVEWPY